MPSHTPIIAYHGTPYRFTQFKCPPGGIHFGTHDQAAHAATIKLARMPADEFEALPEGRSGFRGVIMQVRLHVQKATTRWFTRTTTRAGKNPIPSWSSIQT